MSPGRSWRTGSGARPARARPGGGRGGPRRPCAGGRPAHRVSDGLREAAGLAVPAPSGGPAPEVSDLVGTEGPSGFRATGHLRQDGPLPYASGYVRANGGTGNIWTGLAPRMLPEDFDTESFGYGRSWPLTYDELEPHYRAAEEELGVAADAEEQRERLGLRFPDGYVFPMRPLPAARLDRLLAARLDGRRVKDPVALREVELRVVGTPHARNGVPDPGTTAAAATYRAGGTGGRIRTAGAWATRAASRTARRTRSTPRSRPRGGGALR
ncbi:hypothetical protein O1L60_36655 [Streptomyces diastatochromogenes]|nr:hypothetical protein [Streptomyces diastatochromogenes]